MEIFGLDVDRHFNESNTTQQTKDNIMEPVVTFDPFVRRPFVVSAVQITPENIDELATQLGEIKVKDDEKHILLDRRIVPNIKRAYVGWWVTKLDDNLRCYSPKVFEKEFTLMDTAWDGYFAQVEESAATTETTETTEVVLTESFDVV